MIDDFVRFATVCFEEFGEYVEYWLTLTKSTVSIVIPLQQQASFQNNQQRKEEQEVYQALHHQFVASSLVTKSLMRKTQTIKVGCMLTKLMTYPLTCDPLDVE